MSRKQMGTPKKDGFRMPGEFEPQDQIFMIWPERPDNWRDGGKPVQESFTNVAKAISKYTPVTMLVSPQQFENAHKKLSPEVRVVEMANNDSWVRDCGPSFVKNDKGEVRAVCWQFNAWGGLYDGLYFPWDQDNLVAKKVAELERVDYYELDEFVLEGGSFHVDGEGTVLTTEMCLLSPGRNPDMTKEEIEDMLCEYLNCEKVLWVKDGIDPEETNGHIDDVSCYIRPGEVLTIWTDDKNDPFYNVCQETYNSLSEMTDAKGRKLKVHKLCLPKIPVKINGDFKIDEIEGTIPREDGEICIASYMNFLITNNAIITPQYGDENDALAIRQLEAIFPDHDVVGVDTKEVVYGGGNIHCITQQQPSK